MRPAVAAAVPGIAAECVFSGGLRGPLSKVLASGGTPTAATSLGNGELTHRWPQFLPDGQNFLYLSYKDSDRVQCSVFLARLDEPVQSSQHQHLVRGASMPLYADGFLLFLREDATLVAQSFDIGRGILSGEAVPLGGNIARRSGYRGLAEYSASSNGVLAYLSGSGSQSRLEWRDRAGQLLFTLGEAGYWRDVALSQDGRLVVASRDDAQSNIDLWLHDVSRNTNTRFTSDPGFDDWPVWSPDSTRVLFTSFRGAGGLYEKDASGATEEKLLLKATPGDLFYTWSFDGRHLLYSVVGQKGNADLWVFSVGGESKPVPFLASDFNETRGQFSSDGRWVAYESDESGRPEIYVRGFPQTGGQWKVSAAGGTQPRWRRDGREIYYLGPGSKLVAVEVKPSGAAFEVGSLKELFTAKVTGALSYQYDVTADGKRFVVNSLIEGTVPPITIVLNWPRKLKKP